MNTINDMVDQLAFFAEQVTKVAREVGTEGKLGVQADVGRVQGTWKEITCVLSRRYTMLIVSWCDAGYLLIKWHIT